MTEEMIDHLACIIRAQARKTAEQKAEIESDMVKRVAERLAEHHVAQFGAMNGSDLAMYIGRTWRDFVPQAVVAIAAMQAGDPGIPIYRLPDATDDVLGKREG